MTANMTPDQKKILETVLYTTGLAFLLVGGYAYANPEFLGNVLGLDENTNQITGIVLILAGVADFLIARFMFKYKDKR